MFTREFTLGEAGLHSATASSLMRIAKSFGEPIYVARLSGEAAPVSNQLRVISLGISAFETLILIVNTPDAAIAETVFEQAGRVFAD